MLQTAIPFIGVILSISVFPILIPKIWEKFENLILSFWFILTFLLGLSAYNFKEMMMHDYIPFISILFALFTINGGIHLDIQMKASPINNTLYLAFASILSSIFGTTGSTLLFLKPFLKINHHASYKTHHAIFFIFLVANIGGCLTPLGDAPLFMGFLNGVDFFWTTKNLFLYFLFAFVIILIIFFKMDQYLSRNDSVQEKKFSIKINGKINFLLIFFVILTVLGTPYFKISPLIRDLILCALGAISIILTPKRIDFSWHPFFEVCRVFLVIFTTLIPVSFILHQGYLPKPVSPFQYFWISGILSAFLDNAPTYLVFFHLAGGEATTLMTDFENILKAISLGSVLMGAMTYIGNTPNLIVKSIAKNYHIKMPSFLGFLVWSVSILLPVFLLISFII